MDHSSIQVTVDIYGHLIPGANVSFIDSLDAVSKDEKTSPQEENEEESAEETEPIVPAELIGGGGRTRTYDLRIMSFAVA
jgi:hypothetical protein